MNLSHIELVWVRVRVEKECFRLYLREDDKVFESKMAVSESNMAEFKMAAIIKLSQNDLSEVLFCAKWLNQRWQNSRWLPSSSWVRMNEFESYWISLSHSQSGGRMFLELIWEKITRWLNPRWQCLNPTLQNSRWLPSSSWVRMNKWIFFVPNGCIKDSRIQVGYHHQVK